MRSYGLDIIDTKEWKELQDDFYKNQIEEKYNTYVKNNKIPLKQFDKDLYIEHFLRSCDYTFRLDDEYIPFSQYWQNESRDEESDTYDNVKDVNCGYYYTIAIVSEDLFNYEWDNKN